MGNSIQANDALWHAACYHRKRSSQPNSPKVDLQNVEASPDELKSIVVLQEHELQIEQKRASIMEEALRTRRASYYNQEKELLEEIHKRQTYEVKLQEYESRIHELESQLQTGTAQAGDSPIASEKQPAKESKLIKEAVMYWKIYGDSAEHSWHLSKVSVCEDHIQISKDPEAKDQKVAVV